MKIEITGIDFFKTNMKDDLETWVREEQYDAIMDYMNFLKFLEENNGKDIIYFEDYVNILKRISKWEGDYSVENEGTEISLDLWAES